MFFWVMEILIFMMGIVMVTNVSISEPSDSIGIFIVVLYYLLTIFFLVSPIIALVLFLK